MDRLVFSLRHVGAELQAVVLLWRENRPAAASHFHIYGAFLRDPNRHLACETSKRLTDDQLQEWGEPSELAKT